MKQGLHSGGSVQDNYIFRLRSYIFIFLMRAFCIYTILLILLSAECGYQLCLLCLYGLSPGAALHSVLQAGVVQGLALRVICAVSCMCSQMLCCAAPEEHREP